MDKSPLNQSKTFFIDVFLVRIDQVIIQFVKAIRHQMKTHQISDVFNNNHRIPSVHQI